VTLPPPDDGCAEKSSRSAESRLASLVLYASSIKPEGSEMTTNTNAATFANVQSLEQRPETSDATRMSQYSFLSEMPGLVFGALTLAWIVTSLMALA